MPKKDLLIFLFLLGLPRLCRFRFLLLLTLPRSARLASRLLGALTLGLLGPAILLLILLGIPAQKR